MYNSPCVDTFKSDVPIESRDIYYASYSIALLPIIFPAACSGYILAIVGLPLCGDKCTPANITTWAILMAKALHSVSLDMIFDNP